MLRGSRVRVNLSSAAGAAKSLKGTLGTVPVGKFVGKILREFSAKMTDPAQAMHRSGNFF